MPTLYEEVRAALRDSEFRPRKRLGQNFLIHERVIDSILRLLDLLTNDEVVEIGPGLGFLTRRLLERGSKVWAVEIDSALVQRLRESDFAANPKFQLIHGDILTVALPELLPKRKVKLAGNLPYSIATPVLFRVFECREFFSSMVIMVPKRSRRPNRRETGNERLRDAFGVVPNSRTYRREGRGVAGSVFSAPQGSLDGSEDRAFCRAIGFRSRDSVAPWTGARGFRPAAQDACQRARVLAKTAARGN